MERHGTRDGDARLVELACGGDEAAFAALTERHRRELQVHCYRMLGSFDESQDVVQETFLRAWRRRETYQGRSTFRAWLYRIATNACLDELRRRPRSRQVAGDHAGEVPWLQPFPDRLLDEVADADEGPDAVVIARETVELAFLAAIQHLAPRPRAVLILRDVLGWPAADTASALDMTVDAANSALKRARASLGGHLPRHRSQWRPAADASAEERAVLQRYLAATAASDMAALAALLAEDARQTMPPEPTAFVGRDAVLAAWSSIAEGDTSWGEWHARPTGVNRQPAVANYLRRPGQARFHAFNLDALRIEGGLIVEVTTFAPSTFPGLGLPATLS
ncbi:MAG TPA: RNA polymerase subunit sigma-70 [Pseudonocardia sp.]|nr:RNA polymerase subunit sigma-70 [Pseudonocardia sp.]